MNLSRFKMKQSNVFPIQLLIRVILLTSYSTLSSNAHSEGEPPALPLPASRVRVEMESVWSEAAELKYSYNPVNLGQGFPDFAAPQYLVESLHNATSPHHSGSIDNNQYTESSGDRRLKRALFDYYTKVRGFKDLRHFNDILVTVGAYEALYAAIAAFVNPGDEVLIVEPAFDAYEPMVSMAGGKSVFLPLRQLANSTHANRSSTKELGLDMKEARSKLSNRTRVLVLNTPNNPTGKIFSRHELSELAALCIEHNLLVVADEVYEQFYYDSSEHLSIARLPGMWQRTITIGSAGKTFSVTGWKVGWAFGPMDLMKYMKLVHRTTVYTVATPLQVAIADALRNEMGQLESANGTHYWATLRRDLVAKRDRLALILERAQMRPIVPEGGYFMLADFSKLDQKFAEYKNESAPTYSKVMNNDYKFMRWLARLKSILGIPGSAFYSADNQKLGEHLIRFCFIKSNKTLDDFERLMREFD